MLYPFIYLRVYYRGFQDSTISKMTWFFLWPVVGITGGSMATVHRSWLVQGQNFVACTRLLTHLVMGWPACLDRDFTTAGGPMLCFFGKCPICPMIQCCVFFLDSYLEGGWRWRWWYDWWWLMDLNSAGTQAASFSGRRPGRVMILYQGAFWKSLWSSEGNRTCSGCLGDFLKSMLDPTDSIWFFTDEMLWSNSWWSWVSKTVGG